LVAEGVESFLLRGLRLQFSDPGQRYIQLGLKPAKPYVPALRGLNLCNADQTPGSLIFSLLRRRRIAQDVLRVFFGYVNCIIFVRQWSSSHPMVNPQSWRPIKNLRTRSERP
jgi:hypothetical protein